MELNRLGKKMFLLGKEPRGQWAWRPPARPVAHREPVHPGGPLDCRCAAARTPQHLHRTEADTAQVVCPLIYKAGKCTQALGTSGSFMWKPHQNKVTFESEELTIKCEVTKKSSQQVHDEHGQDGDVGHVLHTLLGSTGVKSGKMTRSLL